MEHGQKYDNTKNYSGKWCLYKRTYISSMQSIFVLGVKDGIVRFVTEATPSETRYADERDFLSCDSFLVNPFAMDIPESARAMAEEKTKGNAVATSENAIMTDCGWKELSDEDRCGCPTVCKYGTSDFESRLCKHAKKGYCTMSVLTSSRDSQYERCAFCTSVPRFKSLSEVLSLTENE